MNSFRGAVMDEYIKKADVLKILSTRNAAWDGYTRVAELPNEDVADAEYLRFWQEQAEKLLKMLSDRIEKEKQNRGVWISRPIGDIPRFYCSRCSIEKLNPTNYCPNCGAEMERG